MEINNLQGVNAYTNSPDSTQSTDTALHRRQNLEAARTDLNTANTDAAKQAFEVNITEEARERLAARKAQDAELERTEEAHLRENQAVENDAPSSQSIVPTHESSQIVNIVA